MADCLSCGESFSHLKPGELCPDCRPADAELTDGDLGPEEEFEPAPSSVTYPPLGVAILSVWHYIGAAVVFVFAFVFLIFPGVLTSHGTIASNAETFSISERVLLFSFAAFISLLSYELGKALWHLRNWARWFVLSVCGIELILGGPPSAMLGRVVSLVTIGYLLAPSIRAAFYRTSQPPRGQAQLASH